MPSSPEFAAVLPQVERFEASSWQPEELTPALRAVPSAAATATPVAAARVFEIGAGSNVPESMLAPARTAAANEGYVAGWRQGQIAGRQDAADQAHLEQLEVRAATAARVAELERATRALTTAAAALDGQAAGASAQLSDLVIAAAYDIAEALVGATLADDALRGRAAVTRALGAVPAGAAATVRLNPADLAQITDTAAYGEHVTLIADPSVQPGDAFAQHGATTVDARLGEGLARVRDLLGRS